MIRVYTPTSPNPTNCGRTLLTKFSHAEGLRRQIVDMVQQKGLNTSESIQTHNDINAEQQEEPEVIYQIKKKSGIASVKETERKSEKKNDKLKKIHLKILRETRGKGSKAFAVTVDPLTDCLQSANSSNTIPDPDKKPTSFSGLTNTELKQKHLNPLPKLIQADKQENKDQKNAENKHIILKKAMNKESEKEKLDELYELRGSAIKTVKNPKSAPGQRSSEASRRHMTIHTSLQLFKRRLKVNQPDLYVQQKVSTNDSDYVIRRVPMKYDYKGNNKGVPTLGQQSTPIEPRLKINSASSKHHASYPRTTSASPHPIMPMSRPNSGVDKGLDKEDNQEKKIRCSYRLPENFIWSKEVSFRDETEMIPNVNTYVLEQAKKSCSKYDGQVTLSTHNLDVHNALTSTTETKVKLGDNNGEVDSRFLKWLEETNLSYGQATPRAASAPAVTFRLEQDKETIEILEFRPKTPFPEYENV